MMTLAYGFTVLIIYSILWYDVRYNHDSSILQWPASLVCNQAGRYNNPMPESTFIPLVRDYEFRYSVDLLFDNFYGQEGFLARVGNCTNYIHSFKFPPNGLYSPSPGWYFVPNIQTCPQWRTTGTQLLTKKVLHSLSQIIVHGHRISKKRRKSYFFNFAEFHFSHTHFFCSICISCI